MNFEYKFWKETNSINFNSCNKTEKVIEHYGWTHEHYANKPTPTNCYNQYIVEIQETKGTKDEQE